MHRFARLVETLEESQGKKEKVKALASYFGAAPARDAAWALYFLLGKKIRRVANLKRLRSWVSEVTGYPDWLIDECVHSVGDAGEALSLLLPRPVHPRECSLGQFVERELLTTPDVDRQASLVKGHWQSLDESECLVMHRILLGGSRFGVSTSLVFAALAEVAGLRETVVVGRLSRFVQPSEAGFLALLEAETEEDTLVQPAPFSRGRRWGGDSEQLEEIERWAIEWWWHGRRVQLVRRSDEVMLWSAEGALVNGRFPELIQAAGSLETGTVIDGVVLDWDPMETPRFPVGGMNVRNKPVFLAFDLLETGGEDLRCQAWERRRCLLENSVTRWRTQWDSRMRPEQNAVQGELFANAIERKRSEAITGFERIVRLSDVLDVSSWTALKGLMNDARGTGANGLVLKRRDGVYPSDGSVRDWLIWEPEPLVIETVLVAARSGNQETSKCYSEYSLAVKHDDGFVTVARLPSGLDDREKAEVDQFVRQHSLGRHGPVRSVEPKLIFCIEFQGIDGAARSRAGISLRRPRMVGWSREKSIDDVGTLDELISMTGTARGRTHEGD